MKFYLEFDLKFEISDGKNLVKLGGRTFLPARKARKFQGRFRGKFRSKFRGKFRGNFVSNFATFFGNFVQQKGGANAIVYRLLFSCIEGYRAIPAQGPPKLRYRKIMLEECWEYRSSSYHLVPISFLSRYRGVSQLYCRKWRFKTPLRVFYR